MPLHPRGCNNTVQQLLVAADLRRALSPQSPVDFALPGALSGGFPAVWPPPRRRRHRPNFFGRGPKSRSRTPWLGETEKSKAASMILGAEAAFFARNAIRCFPEQARGVSTPTAILHRRLFRKAHRCEEGRGERGCWKGSSRRLPHQKARDGLTAAAHRLAPARPRMA
jgi:hypothetical protein